MEIIAVEMSQPLHITICLSRSDAVKMMCIVFLLLLASAYPAFTCTSFVLTLKETLLEHTAVLLSLGKDLGQEESAPVEIVKSVTTELTRQERLLSILAFMMDVHDVHFQFPESFCPTLRSVRQQQLREPAQDVSFTMCLRVGGRYQPMDLEDLSEIKMILSCNPQRTIASTLPKWELQGYFPGASTATL